MFYVNWDLKKQTKNSIDVHGFDSSWFLTICISKSICCYCSQQSWDWFDAVLHLFLSWVSLFISQYPLQPASTIICFTYLNFCLPFLLRPSALSSKIVSTSPSCPSVCHINLSRRLFILAYKLLFSSLNSKLLSPLPMVHALQP